MEKTNKRFVAAAFFFCVFAVSTYADPVFLSIDCGASKGHKDELGFMWVTDEGFIQTGTSLQLFEDSEDRYYANLRYFKEGRSKNCYVLPVMNETTYLLRASFYPGNGTAGPGIKSPVDFNLTVNNNLWFPYSAPSDDERPSGWIDSIVHTFEKTELYVCLLKGTEGYPFINSLELRELNRSSYVETRDQKEILINYGRYNTGTKPDDLDSVVRYPDDIYDRIWFPTPHTEFPAFRRVENDSLPPLPIGESWNRYNWSPTKVRQDAWVGRNLSSPAFPKPAGLNGIHVVFYLMEIRNVNLTDLEENPLGILLGVNDNFYALNITSLDDQEITMTTTVEKHLNINLTVISQPWSKREAILNAYEIYETYDLDTSATYPPDRTTLSGLQKSFELQDWTGDPCFPVEWDWLTCDPKTSRITKLELSHMNISGPIPEDISKFTELTEIHLDNNKLNGSIPESLRLLNKLKILALDNNQLSGQIPLALQNKAGLTFTFTGNSGLCIPESATCAKTPPGPAPAAAFKLGFDQIQVLIGVILALSVANLG